MPINYRDLLAKYMRHIFDCEKTTHLDRANDLMHDVVFTAEELEELERMEKEMGVH